MSVNQTLTGVLIDDIALDLDELAHAGPAGTMKRAPCTPVCS